MFAYKVVALFAFAALASATSDVERALWMVKCAKLAITTGCAEASIPMHTPLRVNKTFTQSGGNALASWTATVENITWAGIPDWTVNASQLSENTDAIARFPFHFWWKNFDIHADYIVTTKEAILEQKFHGNARLQMNEVNWKGVMYFEKMKGTKGYSFPKLDLEWHVDEVKADIMGMNVIGNTIATAIRLGLKTVFDTQAMKGQIESFIVNILNTRWAAHPDRVNKIIDYCKRSGL